jgi:hypothetical protein
LKELTFNLERSTFNFEPLTINHMPHQSLYQTIFNHGTSGNDVVNELEQVTKEFPYFSLAHFFLLKNMEAGHEDVEKVAAKTALHFNNPYLLRQQLAKEIKPVLEAEEFVEAMETATIVCGKSPVMRLPVTGSKYSCLLIEGTCLQKYR